MFYDVFIKLCNENGEKPTVVAQSIGLNKSAATGWKNGSEPTDATKAKIADRFGVDVSIFNENKKSAVPKGTTQINDKYYKLSDADREIIDALIVKLYKAQSDD